MCYKMAPKIIYQKRLNLRLSENIDKNIDNSELNSHTPEPAAKRIRKPKKSQINAKTISDLVLKSLDDDQGIDIMSIDLAGKTSIADIMIVASGRNSRHVAAMAEHISSVLKDNGAGRLKVQGLENADWVLIDAGDVIIHLFRPEVREFYSLETIWTGQAKHLSQPI